MAALSSKFASLTSPSRQTKPSEEVTSPSSKPISGFNAVPARDEFFRDRPAPRVPPTSGPQSVNPLLSPGKPYVDVFPMYTLETCLARHFGSRHVVADPGGTRSNFPLK